MHWLSGNDENCYVDVEDSENIENFTVAALKMPYTGRAIGPNNEVDFEVRKIIWVHGWNFKFWRKEFEIIYHPAASEWRQKLSYILQVNAEQNILVVKPYFLVLNTTQATKKISQRWDMKTQTIYEKHHQNLLAGSTLSSRPLCDIYLQQASLS